jgi:alkanesulfonate monooxygenase SsuD/methylene tetrahydromethanopterin reductase-like flavin-dependent oxidoreductase (luciferase family)
MRFALSLPNAGPPGRLVEIAATADASGWDAVFLWDHLHLFREMRLELHDPWVVLGAIAAASRSVRLGTMITPLPRRRPQVFAKQVVTLDHLSGGRVIAGVGLGFPPDDEFAMFGEDPDDRVRAAKLDEALDVVTALWSGQPVDHHGPHYRASAQLLPPPVQRPRPPIWVAAQWPRRGPLERAHRYEGVVPIGADGQPADVDVVRQVAELVGPGCEVAASWLPGNSVAEYAAAGATWLIESRWPVDRWLEELTAAAATDPHAAA